MAWREKDGSFLVDGAGAVFQFFRTVSLCQAAWLLPYLDWPSARWHRSTALSQPDFGKRRKWHSQAGVTEAPFQGIHTSFEEFKLQEQVWWVGTSWKWRRFWSSFWQNGEVELRPCEHYSRCLCIHWHRDKNLHEIQLMSEEISIV